MAFEIRSEEEAWEVLDGLVHGRIKIDSIEDIELGDWVKSTLYIPNQRYDSALNAYMMRGWIDAQAAIYRSYALVAHGEANGRLLSDVEKDELELIVKVKSGSSDQEAQLMDVIGEVLTGAVDKMDPTTLAIVIVGLALIWAGQATMRSWLQNRKEERLAESNNKTMIQALETIQTVAAGDKEKQALIQGAIQQSPVLKGLKDEADGAKQSMVRHASQTDAVVNGINLPAGAASAITTSTRTSAEEERKDGAYYIRKVDTTVPDGFRVHVEHMDSGEAFQASVQEVMSSLEDRQIIQDAEWNKVPVRLQINAKVKKSQVLDAIILRADKYEHPEETTKSRTADTDKQKVRRGD
ncbi:hypothetical protein [Aliiruegeria sabulilitoris]|uniref:hypothetical protein n=1 Tax=Aliiruegeria sabulilitoris TaxID=1510458 RepID=UPI00082D0ADD|nr:hypothetical protein [Aliiruegeria sabulilitoris]NDR55698.1 hypothetical protein [Pseudoruegeria sp. M32A2M]